ncbi:MAG: ArsB/NhaD family transporter [Kineosporiaceae bacterium]
MTALRRLGVPAAVVALAVALVATGVLPGGEAAEVLERVVPVLGFLVAVTVLAELADGAGLFDVAAALAVRAGRGRVPALGALVVVLAVACTVLGSLDTTAVLLTPVVVRLARRLGLDPLPWAVTTLWLANTASFLLPVSNLTNLLAAQRLDWTAAAWAARIWPVAATAALLTAGLAWLLFRGHVRGRYAVPRRDGRPAGDGEGDGDGDREGHGDRDGVLLGAAALACLGFVAAVLAEVPAWAAAGTGAVVLAVVAVVRRPGLVRPQLVPVTMPLVTGALFLLLAAADRHGARGGGSRTSWTPAGPAGRGRTAVASAVSASLVNNLPAYLALEPVAAAGPGGSAVPLLAVLVGVNAGPLLTPWGSLAVGPAGRALPRGPRPRHRRGTGPGDVVAAGRARRPGRCRGALAHGGLTGTTRTNRAQRGVTGTSRGRRRSRRRATAPSRSWPPRTSRRRCATRRPRRRGSRARR